MTFHEKPLPPDTSSPTSAVPHAGASPEARPPRAELWHCYDHGFQRGECCQAATLVVIAPVSARVPLSEAAAPREEPRAEPLSPEQLSTEDLLRATAVERLQAKPETARHKPGGVQITKQDATRILGILNDIKQEPARRNEQAPGGLSLHRETGQEAPLRGCPMSPTPTDPCERYGGGAHAPVMNAEDVADVRSYLEPLAKLTGSSTLIDLTSLCDSHESLRTALASAGAALAAKDAEQKRSDEMHRQRYENIMAALGKRYNTAEEVVGAAIHRIETAQSALDEAKRREEAWRAFSDHLAICMQCGEGSSLLCVNAVRLHEAAARAAVSRGEADNG